MNQDEPDEKKVTYEQVDMIAIFDRLRREIAPRLHPAWDVTADGMPFRAVPGDGPQDLNALLIWFHQKQSKIASAVDALEEMCCEATKASTT
jgi:hypothetical protein